MLSDTNSIDEYRILFIDSLELIESYIDDFTNKLEIIKKRKSELINLKLSLSIKQKNQTAKENLFKLIQENPIYSFDDNLTDHSNDSSMILNQTATNQNSQVIH
jgi:hypothetical protein